MNTESSQVLKNFSNQLNTISNKIIKNAITSVIIYMSLFSRSQISLRSISGSGTDKAAGALSNFSLTSQGISLLISYLTLHMSVLKENVYMTCNQLNFRAASNTLNMLDLRHLNTLVFDFDGLNDATRTQLFDTLRSNALLPACSLITKNGVHLHYLASGIGTIERYTSIHRCLQEKFKSLGFTADPAVSNPAGLIRVGGTLHNKNRVITPLDIFQTHTQSFDPVLYYSSLADRGSDKVTKSCTPECVHEPKNEVIVDSSFCLKADYTGCTTVYDVVSKKKGNYVSAPAIHEILAENGIKLSVRGVTRHLAKLNEYGLITRTRVGKFVKDAVNEASTYTLNMPKGLQVHDIKAFAALVVSRLGKMSDKEYCRQYAEKYFGEFLKIGAKFAEAERIAREEALKFAHRTTSAMVEAGEAEMERVCTTINDIKDVASSVIESAAKVVRSMATKVKDLFSFSVFNIPDIVEVAPRTILHGL